MHSDDTPHDQQTNDLDQLRAMAQALLADDTIASQLPPEAVEALRGLLAEQPTDEQVQRGMAAVEAVVAAMAAARTDAQTESLPDALRAWYRTPSWNASRRWLADHLSDLPLDAPALLDAAAARARSAGDDDGARLLARHAALLSEARRVGVDAAYRAIVGEDAFRDDDEEDEQPGFDVALAQQMEEWIRTAPDWDASRAYLQAHANALLTDEAEHILTLLYNAQQADGARRGVAEHQQLLHNARAQGIDAAYDAFLAQRRPAGNGAGTSGTGNAEIDALLRELFDLNSRNADPRRQEAICRRILEIDSQAHALDIQLRVAILGTLGVALSDQAGLQTGAEQQRLLQEAESAYRQALSASTPNTPDWAATQNNLGNALSDQAGLQTGAEQQRLLQEAESAYRQALSIYPLELQPQSYRTSARALARTLLQQAAIVGDNRAEQQALESVWTAVTPAIAAADLLELRAPSLTFRQQEWSENASLYNLAGCVQARRGRVGEAVALIERGRARGLAEAAGRRSADLAMLTPADRAQYLLAVQQTQTIEAQGRQGGDPLALVAEARAANERLQALVARLRKAYPGFLPERWVSIPALAAGLNPGEVIVYLIPQEVGTMILVIPHSGKPRMRWLADLTADAIFRLAVQPDAEGRNREGFLPAALGWLHDDPLALVHALDTLLPDLGGRLMRTVVRLVRAAGCHRAVLVPSGYLSVLPLHAASYEPLAGEPATAPHGRRYACDDLAITYAPSGLTCLDARQTATRQRRAGPARRIFVVGNPQLTPRGQPWTTDSEYYLRYAEWEARRVGDLAAQRQPPLEVDLALTDQATWTRVVAGLAAADVAHLAMHASFNFDNPEQSAFFVAFQAELMLRDLLDPAQAQLLRLRLVVLSACQSAIGDFSRQSEEAVGLFGALLAGGVPGVIGTLWSVNDLATAALMESFARRYLVEGASPDAALRGAARELRGVAESAADPAEKGPQQAQPRHIAEEITTVEVELTPARRRWQELEVRDPEAVGATRQLSPEALAQAGQQVAEFRRIPRNHPIYWAAFVFHGASLPLDGDQNMITDDSAAARRTAPPEGTMSDDQHTHNAQNTQNGGANQQAEGEELPVAQARASSYFAAAGEVCPRCHGQDYIPIRDAMGRDLRHCMSCGRDYLPGQNAGGNGQ